MVLAAVARLRPRVGVLPPGRRARSLVAHPAAAPGRPWPSVLPWVANSAADTGHVLAGLGGADAVPDSRAAVQASPRATGANGEPLGPATAAAPTPSASLSAGQPVIPRLAVTPLAASRDLWRPKPACMNSFTATGVPRDCVFGDPAGSKTIVLIGTRMPRRGSPPWTPGPSGCTGRSVPGQERLLVLEPHLLLQGARVYSECQSWNKPSTLGSVLLSGVDLVLVVELVAIGAPSSTTTASGYETRRRTRSGSGLPAVNWRCCAASRRPSWSCGDTPWAGTDVPRCLADHLTRVDQCGFAVGHAHQDGWMLRAERAGAASLSGVSWIDMTPGVPAGSLLRRLPLAAPSCRDGPHLTATFSRSLWLPSWGRGAEATPRGLSRQQRPD